MQRRLATMFGLAGALMLLVGACGGDDAPSRETMIDDAIEQAGLDEATATCLVDGLLDEFGSERVEEMVTSNEDPEDLSEDEQAALTEVGLECFDTDALLEDSGVDIEGAPTTTVGE
jgi:hypothetical protein